MTTDSDPGVGLQPKGLAAYGGLRSWFSPVGLRDLFLNPRAFFSREENIGFTPAALTAAAIGACVEVIDKIDQKAAIVQAGLANQGTRELVGWMVGDWAHYWGCVVGIGLLGSVIAWYLQGWWYGCRLRWSGAPEARFPVARRVSALQQLVVTLPALTIALSETLRFADYGQAMMDDSAWLTIGVPFVFVVWSCWVSYCAATTVFPGARRRAWLWFVVLPMAVYVLGSLGVIVAWLHHG